MAFSTTHRNLLANAAGTGWNILSVYAFIPFYLQFLGEESYGLIMFASSIQSVIMLTDVGLTAVLRRNLSWGKHSIEKEAKDFSLLRSIESLYGAIFLAVGLLVLVTSTWVATSWLRPESTSTTEIKWAFVLMVAIAFAQMQSSLYNGSLMAMHRQVTANLLQFLYTLARNGLVVLVISWYPSATAFLAWQLAVTVIYANFQRSILFKHFSISARAHAKAIDLRLLRDHWKVSGLFLSVSVLSTINLQVDKFVVTSILSLSSLGYYNTAYALGQALVAITRPIAAALSPTLINAYSVGEKDSMSAMFHSYAYLTNLATSALGVTICLNSYEILVCWTGNEDFASHASSPAALMSIAGIFLAAQVLPYTLAVASADLRPILITCLLNIALTIPGYYLMGTYHGMVGCALVWLISNVAMMFINVYFYMRKTLPNEYGKWILLDFTIPCVMATTTAYMLSSIRLRSDRVWVEVLSVGSVFIAATTLPLLLFFIQRSLRLSHKQRLSSIYDQS